MRSKAHGRVRLACSFCSRVRRASMAGRCGRKAADRRGMKWESALIEGLERPMGSVYGPCMATKTITVDLAAYEMLAAKKRPGQSFSEVIKECLEPPRTASGLLMQLPAIAQGIPGEVIDAMAREVKRRGRERLRPPRR